MIDLDLEIHDNTGCFHFSNEDEYFLGETEQIKHFPRGRFPLDRKCEECGNWVWFINHF